MGIEKMTKAKELGIEKCHPIYVFYKTAKQAHSIEKYGDLIFTSSKHKYSCLYVPESSLTQLTKKLSALPYVVDVQVGKLSELSEDFAAAFVETNASLKKAPEFA